MNPFPFTPEEKKESRRFLDIGNGQRKKRITLVLLASIVMLFLFVFNFQPIFAQTSENPQFGLEYADTSMLGTQDIRITIFKLINVFLGIVGIIFLIIVIYGGYIFMMSKGDANEVTRGKRILRDAVIGLLIIFAALALVQFILHQLGLATGMFGPGTKPYGDSVLVGGLGNGPIEAHYPARDQKDVPRNTMIAITWKEAMNPESFFANFDDDDGNNTLNTGDKVETYLLSGRALSTRIYIWDEVSARFEDGSGNPIPGDEYIGLRSDRISIFKKKDTADVLGSEAVRVGMTTDRKTFTFWPMDPLGSPSEDIEYQVDVSDVIEKEGGNKAFSSGIGGVGYFWNFITSTIIDTTPPKLKNIYPRAKEILATEPANVVITMEFNEALNPLTSSGVINFGGANKVSEADYNAYISSVFNNIEIKYTDPTTGIMYLAGEFTLSNQYKTIEFLPTNACGVNACGQTVYCLERNPNTDLEYITNVYAAFLNKNLPQDEGDYYAFTDATGNADGITDMAVNSFDGDNDGISQGSYESTQRPKTNTVDQIASSDAPYYYTGLYYLNDPVSETGDDATWKFMINYDLILDSPEITDVNPDPDEQGVNRDTSIEAEWNRVMYSKTLNTKNVLLPLPQDSSWLANYWLSAPMEEYTDALGDIKDRTRLNIHHDTFPDPTKEPSYEATVFTPEITSGVQDVYQNCYSSCTGPEAEDTLLVRVINRTDGQIVEEYTANMFFTDNVFSNQFYSNYVSDANSGTYIDGMTELFRSRLFVYRNKGTGRISIGVVHGYVKEATTQNGVAQINFRTEDGNISQDPYFSIADDTNEIYTAAGAPLVVNTEWTEATGKWEWSNWTDGAMIDMPLDTAWKIEIDPTLWQDITNWEFLSAKTSGSTAGVEIKQILPLQTIDFNNPQADYEVEIEYAPTT